MNINASFSKDRTENYTAKWLRLEQQETPIGAEFVTNKSINNMLNLAEAGLSAFTYINEDCRVINGEARIYFLIHHSVGLTYSLDSNFEVLQEGIYVVPYSESINPKFQKVIFTENIFSTFNYHWEGNVYSQKIEKIRPTVRQNNGFIFISESSFGMLRMTGNIKYDLAYVVVTEGVSTINVTAKYPTHLPEKDQEQTIITLNVPQCIQDKFNECTPDGKESDWNDYPFDFPDEWDTGTVTQDSDNILYIDGCTGEVLRKSYV